MISSMLLLHDFSTKVLFQKQPEGEIKGTHTRLTALFLGLPRWAGTRKVKPIWILLKQETVSGSGVSWAICKSAPCFRQPCQHPTTQFFTCPDALPAAQPTVSKHWRQNEIKGAMAIKLMFILAPVKPTRLSVWLHISQYVLFLDFVWNDGWLLHWEDSCTDYVLICLLVLNSSNNNGCY